MKKSIYIVKYDKNQWMKNKSHTLEEMNFKL